MDQVQAIVGRLDSFRASCLSPVLKFHFLRELYRNCATRLGMGYLLTVAFYLPLSIFRPDLLLISGPLIFGYPHLIASLRYVQKNSGLVFIMLTLVCIAGHLSGLGLSTIRELPFGVWQLGVALVGLGIMNIREKSFSFVQMVLVLAIAGGMIQFAYAESIIFIGAMLILHNWVGYGYWLMAAKDKKRKLVALMSLGLFLIIHLLVLRGQLDQHFPLEFPGETRATGWYLASWSQEPVIWYRWLVLYAFGLSVHYFVWLKAIPQSQNPIEHPNSLRRSLVILRQDVGKNMLLILTMVSLIGVGVWAFSLNWGSKIYFEMAILHGSLELVFLLNKSLLAMRTVVRSSLS